MKILQLSTYPLFKTTNSGGQRRVKRIKEFYESIGHQVIYCGITDKTPTDEFFIHPSIRYFYVNSEIRAKIRETPYFEDILLGKAALSDSKIAEQLKALILEFRPDVIQFEHPFVWPSYQHVKISLAPSGATPFNPILIYSSHNVEVEMKRKIYEKFLTQEQIQSGLQEVELIERAALRGSSGILTVTHSDQTIFSPLTKAKIHVAPNGTDPVLASTQNCRRWAERLPWYKTTQRAIFISSAHPPNFEGFIHWVGQTACYLRPDQKILVVGTIVGLFEKTDLYRYRPGLIESRIEFLAELSDDDVNALIHLSDAVLLPIGSSSGGSNLKTAQALVSGKKVVATRQAFHGYEKYLNSSQVILAQTPDEFQNALRQALEVPSEGKETRTPVYDKLNDSTLSELYWTKTLEGCKLFLQSLKTSHHDPSF